MIVSWNGEPQPCTLCGQQVTHSIQFLSVEGHPRLCYACIAARCGLQVEPSAEARAALATRRPWYQRLAARGGDTMPAELTALDPSWEAR